MENYIQKKKKTKRGDMLGSDEPIITKQRSKNNTTEMNAAKVKLKKSKNSKRKSIFPILQKTKSLNLTPLSQEMFQTLQSNMEMLQLENKRLYQENIQLKSSKVPVAHDPRNMADPDSRDTFAPTVTTDDGVESNSENSNFKEEDQIKFLKSKLQVRDMASIIKRMNKTLRILVQFNKDMADEIATFKTNEELLINYVKKVDDMEERYESRIEDMSNNYEERIRRLEMVIENQIGINHDENYITALSNEKEFWKQQTMKLTHKIQSRGEYEEAKGQFSVSAVNDFEDEPEEFQG